MTTAGGYAPHAQTGYRLDELASAFDRVRDPRDWRAPIDTAASHAEPTARHPVLP